jgi:hypothetical protein
VFVLLPRAQYRRLQQDWQLPPLPLPLPKAAR